MKELNERSKRNLIGVHPNLRLLMVEAIKDCPVEFTITEGLRTTERQQQLYAQGRTTKGAKVTNCDGIVIKSNHQAKADGLGYAVDLYANPINVNDTTNIRIVADHIKRKAQKLDIAIVWGGDWNMKDYPHFEIIEE